MNPTGSDLNVVIVAEPNHKNEWMAFSSWYSVKSLYPESTISLAVYKGSPTSVRLFRWTYRVKIKKYWIKEATGEYVTAGTLLIRNLPNDFTSIKPVLASSDEIVPFVAVDKAGSYSEKSWKYGEPFSLAHKLWTENMSINEKLVLSLWQKMHLLYSAIGNL